MDILKNQHFISKSEQKWNALVNDKNKIYCFEKINTESFKEAKSDVDRRDTIYKNK